MHWKLTLCERGSENVTFEVVNINGIVGAVLDMVVRSVVGRMCAIMSTVQNSYRRIAGADKSRDLHKVSIK